MKKALLVLVLIALLAGMAHAAGWTAGRLQNGAPGWYIGTCHADRCYTIIRPIPGGLEFLTADETIRITPPYVYRLPGGWK